MIQEKISGVLKEERRRLRREVRERTFTYLVAAFGLVAGLAWNEAVKSLIDYFFPLSANTLFAKFVYAILITLIVVFVTVYLEKALKTDGEENKTK